MARSAERRGLPVADVYRLPDKVVVYVLAAENGPRVVVVQLGDRHPAGRRLWEITAAKGQRVRLRRRGRDAKVAAGLERPRESGDVARAAAGHLQVAVVSRVRVDRGRVRRGDRARARDLERPPDVRDSGRVGLWQHSIERVGDAGQPRPRGGQAGCV